MQRFILFWALIICAQAGALSILNPPEFSIRVTDEAGNELYLVQRAQQLRAVVTFTSTHTADQQSSMTVRTERGEFSLAPKPQPYPGTRRWFDFAGETCEGCIEGAIESQSITLNYESLSSAQTLSFSLAEAEILVNPPVKLPSIFQICQGLTDEACEERLVELRRAD